MSRIALGLSTFRLPVKRSLSGFVSSALCHADLQRLSSFVNVTWNAAIEGWIRTSNGDTCFSHSHSRTYSMCQAPSILLPRPQTLRQVHPHPSRRQTDLLFFIHRHPRIVPLQQRNVHPLRFHVLYILFGFFDLPWGGLGGDGVADALLNRGGSGERSVR